MTSRVLISNKARDLLEKEQEKRIRAKWKRRTSLKEIVSEAISMFAGLGSDPDTFKDDNSIIKHEEGSSE